MTTEIQNTYFDLMRLGFEGGLASCESCVESRHAQDRRDAKIFLEAGAEAGVFERTFLLDLYGRLGPRSTLSERELEYDEPVYLSAPRYRMKKGDRRQILTRAREAIREAIRLYTEELSSDAETIARAYEAAIAQGLITGDSVPPEDAELSEIAMLRSIVRAFRDNQDESVSSAELREQAQREALAFIRREGSGREPHKDYSRRPPSRELEEFVLGALRDPKQAVNDGIVPAAAEDRYIRAAIGIAERLYRDLDGDERTRFAVSVGKALAAAQSSEEPAREFARQYWGELVASPPADS